MTLITYRKQDDDYFDKIFFSGDVHWFWSSTCSRKENKAYYIDITQGKVLKDEFDHQNAILLCYNGKPNNLGDIIHVSRDQAGEIETEVLRDANMSRHLYGICLSVCASDSIGINLMDMIKSSLHKCGYFITSNLTRLARTFPNSEDIYTEMENQDSYVLVLDRNAKRETLDMACRELQVARNLGLSIFLYHNFQDGIPSSWQLKLELSNDDLAGAEKYKDAQYLPPMIIADLNSGIDRNTSLGWIRYSIFDSIKRNIEKINKVCSLLDASENVVNVFIDKCNVKDLRQAFEECGIISEKPIYGEQAWFVSADNPIRSFFPQKEISGEHDLPILFEKMPSRFELLEEGNGYVIVKDNYLHLKWWTQAIKKTSYDEAESFAQKISQEWNENWRIPTIEEMKTLLTRTRINRKFMDERVFPIGRWFWTSSRKGNVIYYIDFNYSRGSINREDLSQYKDDFPIWRKKSVLLVSDFEIDIMPPKDKAVPKKSVGGKMEAIGIPILMQTVEFLFDEVSKILDERRDNRKSKKDEAGKKGLQASDTPVRQAELTTKEDLLHATIDQIIWPNKQEEVERLTILLRTHISNYYIAQQQIAEWGMSTVPPIKIHEREHALAGIDETTRQLEKALSAIYGKKVSISE